MKLYKFMILIIALIMIAGAAIYTIFTSDMFDSSEPVTYTNTVNQASLQ